MMILTFLTDKAPKLPSSLSSRLFGRSKEAALSRAVFFQSNRWLASQLLGRPPRWEWKNRSALNCKSDELMPIVKKNRFFPIFIKDKDGSWWVVWGWDKSAQWLRTVFPCHLKNIFFAEKKYCYWKSISEKWFDFTRIQWRRIIMLHVSSRQIMNKIKYRVNIYGFVV